MISRLSGSLLTKHPEEIVVDCSGVGYGLVLPMSSYALLPAEGEPVALFVHTYVREELIQLYGFLTEMERILFRKLIGISGVGPKLAVAIMSGFPAPEFMAIISRKESRRLTTIPGVGKKTADRLVLELSDKLAGLVPVSEAAPNLPEDSPTADVVSALVNLGYRRDAAEEAAARTAREASGDFDKILRESLRLLSGGR